MQKIRLMMDCGSQRSYLVKQAAENLSLPVTGRQQLSIAAFGSTRCSGVTQYTLSSIPKLDHQEIGLFVVPHICNLLTTQSIATSSKTYVHLAHLKLADESQDGRLQVDMLIGSDLYWQFVTGETI